MWARLFSNLRGNAKEPEFEKEEKSGRNHSTHFLDSLKSCGNPDSVSLAERQTYHRGTEARTQKQPHTVWPLIVDKGAQQLSGGKKLLSTNSAGVSGHH